MCFWFCFYYSSIEDETWQAEDPTSELAEMLSQKGLDGEYWASAFRERLGVTKPEQTQYIGVDNLMKLQQAKKHDWEATALRKILGINDDEYERAVNVKERQKQDKRQEAMQLLKDIQEQKQKRTRDTEKIIAKKLDQLRKVLDVDKEQWVKEYGHENLDNMICKMTSDLRNLEKMVEGSQELSSRDLLVNASC